MAENVNIPVTLEVTDISTGQVDMSEVQKSITARMSGIKTAVEKTIGSIDTSALNKSLGSAIGSVERSYKSAETAQAKFNDAMRKAGESSVDYKAKLSEVESQIKVVQDKWNAYNDFMQRSYEQAKARQNAGEALAPNQSAIIKNYEAEFARYQADLAKAKQSLPNPNDFIPSGTESALSRLAQAYRTIGQAVEGVNKSQQNWNNSVQANRMSDEYQKSETTLRKLTTQAENLVAKADKMKAVGASESAWRSLQYDAQQLDKEIQNVVSDMTKMVETGSAFRFSPASMDTNVQQLTEQYNAQLEIVRALEAEIARLNGSMKDTSAVQTEMESLRTATSEYKIQLEELTKERAAQNKLVRAARSTMRKQVTAENTDKATAEYNKQKKLLDAIDAKIVRVRQDMEQASAKYAEASARASEFSTHNDGVTASVSRLNGELDTARAKLEDIATARDRATVNVNTDAQSSQLNKLASLAKRLRDALHGASAGASSFGRNASNSFESVLRLSRRIDSGFKNLGKSISGIIKKFASLSNASAKSHLGMQKDLKKTMRMVLQWGFGIRSVYFLIRRLRSTFVTGMNTLATQFPEINSQLSALTRSFHEMKASLTTAFQPIASYVIPLLIKLMDYISAAARAVGSFFAVLTGQKYIYKATAAEKDYADSITGTGNAAEEAEDKLASYDKLDVIDKDKDKSGGGGSKGNIFDDVTFEKVDVGGAISEFAEMIKEAWKKADFTDVGVYVGEKLLSAIEMALEFVREKVQPFAEKLGKCIGTFINGVVSVDGLAEKLGELLAEALNTAMMFMHSLLTTTNWLDVGKFIADFCDSSIRNFNWELLGQTIAEYLTAGVNTWWSFATNFDFSGLGDRIGSSIQTFLSTMSIKDETGLTVWQKLGQALSRTVTGLLSTVTSALEKIDWFQVGVAIGEFISSIDWGKVVWDFTELVSSVVAGIAKAFMGWAETEPISAAVAAMLTTAFLGVKVAPVVSGLMSFVPKIVEVFQIVAAGAGTLSEAMNLVFGAVSTTMSGIGSIIGGVFMAITNFFSMLKNGFSWLKEILMVIGVALTAVGAVILGVVSGPVAAIVAAVVAAVMTIVVLVKQFWNEICGFFSNLWSMLGKAVSKICEIGKNIIDGLVSGVSSAWKAATQFFSNLWNGFIDLICDIFGIHSPSKVMQDVGNNLIDGLVIALGNMWDKISGFFSGLVTNIGNIWNKIKTAAGNAWNGIKSTVTNTASQLWSSISGHFNTVKTQVSNTWTDMKSAASTGWSNIKGAISSATSTLWSGISGHMGNLKNHLSNTWSTIKNTASSSWRTLISSASTWASDMVSGFKNGIMNRLSSLLDSVRDLAGRVRSYLHFSTPDEGPLADYETWMPDFVEGLARGIRNNVGVVANATQSLTSTIKGGFNSGFNDIQNVFLNSLSQMCTNSGNTMGNIGNTSMDRLTGALSGKINTVTSRVRQLSSGMVSAMSSIPGQFSNVGQNMMYGITNGISSKLSYVYDSIRNALSGMVSRAKDSLGIHSPSKVMAKQIGKWIPLGVAGGIEANADSITKVMSGISDRLGKFDLKLPSLSGLGNVKMPKIATGNVVPPTKEFMSKFTGESEEQNDAEFIEKFKEAMREILAEFSSNREPIVLQLNGRTIAQVVWDEESKKYKQTGKPSFAY